VRHRVFLCLRDRLKELRPVHQPPRRVLAPVWVRRPPIPQELGRAGGPFALRRRAIASMAKDFLAAHVISSRGTTFYIPHRYIFIGVRPSFMVNATQVRNQPPSKRHARAGLFLDQRSGGDFMQMFAHPRSSNSGQPDQSATSDKCRGPVSFCIGGQPGSCRGKISKTAKSAWPPETNYSIPRILTDRSEAQAVRLG